VQAQSQDKRPLIDYGRHSAAFEFVGDLKTYENRLAARELIRRRRKNFYGFRWMHG
jgi:hypothetical protein